MILQKPNLLQMLTTIQASKKMTISILRQITMRKVRQIIIQTTITDIKTDFYSDLIENNGTPAPNADVINFLSRTISNPLTDNDFCHSFY